MKLLSPLVLGIILLVACSPNRPTTYPVSGTVTWNGDPLPEGDIIFEASDGIATPSAGKVREGQFAFDSTPGKKRVQIHASRPAAKIDPVMKSVPRQPYLPERYNAHTTLTAEVVPGGENRFVFQLTSK